MFGVFEADFESVDVGLDSGDADGLSFGGWGEG